MSGAGRWSWMRLRDADPSYKPKRIKSFDPVCPPRLIDIEDFFKYDKLSFENISEDRCGITISLWPEFPSHFM